MSLINLIPIIKKFNNNKVNNDFSTSILTSQRQISSPWFKMFGTLDWAQQDITQHSFVTRPIVTRKRVGLGL